MAKITLKGNPVNTSGELPAVGSTAPDVTMVKSDLSEVSLTEYADKKKILNIFPSIDTGTCAMSVRQFNKMAAEINDAVVLCVCQKTSRLRRSVFVGRKELKTLRQFPFFAPTWRRIMV